jgi:hypothetical protein
LLITFGEKSSEFDESGSGPFLIPAFTQPLSVTLGKLECGMRNAEVGIWNAEGGIWKLEWGMGQWAIIFQNHQ